MNLTLEIPYELLKEAAQTAIKKAVEHHYGIGRSEWEKVPGRDAVRNAVKACAENLDMTPMIEAAVRETVDAAIREAATRDLSKRAKTVYKRHRDAELMPPDPEDVKMEIMGETP